MESVFFPSVSCSPAAANHRHNLYQLPCSVAYGSIFPCLNIRRRIQSPSLVVVRSAANASTTANSTPQRSGVYTVGDFMTRKEDLHVVKTTTPVDEALEALVDKKISGFPVIDDDWKLIGVVSDYDLLALDSISGCGQADTNLFPDVDSTWKTFNELQRLINKTNGKVIGDLMTPAPLIVRQTTNLGDAVRLLLETKYRRLPVVDSAGRLAGILTRGDVVKAALQIKHANQRYFN